VSESVEKVVIVGSGPSGWTAAIYAARAQLDPIVYAGVAKQDPGPMLPGGQLMLTTDVENYPGFPDGVTGPDMMEKFQKQAERFGTRVLLQDIDEIDFSDDPVKPPHAAHEQGRDGHGPRGDHLDRRDRELAGARERAAARADRRRRERLRRLRRGAADVPGAPLAVVGGGDTAMEEATFLTKFASKVYVIHRRDELRASKVMQERLLSKDNAEVLWNKTVVDCLSAPDHLGNDKLTAVVLEDTQTGERSELAVKGLFIAIGHTPATKFLRETGLEFDDAGYIDLKGRSSATNLPGVFAAGDVADAKYRQAITAAGMGCQAALDAEHWLGAHDLV
jgi:thioredoxin reductase (NADPH)